tara:strand:- start:400 stop:606 length:207 start_codon:yes stop_codon:yes gene_type:complete
MNKKLLSTIREDVCENLQHGVVRHELLRYLTETIFFSEDGEKLTLNLDDFDWEVSLDLKWHGKVTVTA